MRDTTQGTTAARVKDPVCGMTIDAGSAAGTSEFQGQPYFFCSAACKTKFDAEPGRFTSGRGGADA